MPVSMETCVVNGHFFTFVKHFLLVAEAADSLLEVWLRPQLVQDQIDQRKRNKIPETEFFSWLFVGCLDVDVDVYLDLNSH